jgi:aspartyl-tRNA(Asn)/glutamyl-tRNA(Gln) amidotransferase subunit C
MAITFDDVRHIASLARLGVDDARLPALVAELNGILGHMDVLQRVDVSGVPPEYEVGVPAMPLRGDDGVQYPLTAPRESFAPAMRDGFYLVPRLATHEDAEA